MITLSSINCLIGSWNYNNRLKKRELLEFVARHNKVQFQQGSINTGNKDHGRYWEYATALGFTQAENKHVLDVGGANSLLSWYLGSIGANVISIDLVKSNVNKAVQNNRRFGFDNVEILQADVMKVEFPHQFDYVYCINVIEHVMEHARPKFKPGKDAYWGGTKQYTPSEVEVKAEQTFIESMVNCLKSGGVLVVSYDYKSFGRYRCQPKCAYMRGPEDVNKRIIEASGLKVFGDMPDFTEDLEAGSRLASTGIIFLEKENE